MARLVQRLPLMICPRWTNTRTHAVALKDVVHLLDYVVGRETHYSRAYDIGAPDVVTYRSMMQMTARALGKRRFFIPSRFLSPGLSRLWRTEPRPPTIRAVRAADAVARRRIDWARYDPPFKPWFLRRNEILTMFRVTGSQR